MSSLTKRRLIYIVGGGIAVAALWFLYNKSAVKKKPQRIKPKKKQTDRYSHFLSIRIDNPSIVNWGKEIQVKHGITCIHFASISNYTIYKL